MIVTESCLISRPPLVLLFLVVPERSLSFSRIQQDPREAGMKVPQILLELLSTFVMEAISAPFPAVTSIFTRSWKRLLACKRKLAAELNNARAKRQSSRRPSIPALIVFDD